MEGLLYLPPNLPSLFFASLLFTSGSPYLALPDVFSELSRRASPAASARVGVGRAGPAVEVANITRCCEGDGWWE